MHTVDSEDGSTFAVRATPRALTRFRCLLLLALVQSDLVAELRMRACIVCVCCVCVCVVLCVYVCVCLCPDMDISGDGNPPIGDANLSGD